MLRDVLISKGLSNREAEVAELVTQGLSNKEVANRLFVTEKTVKFHLTNIYKKMSVKSRAQLIVWCLPHMSFIEKDQGRTTQEPSQQVSQMPIGQQNIATTIPAGSQTVGGTIHNPQNNNGGFGHGGNNNGGGNTSF